MSDKDLKIDDLLKIYDNYFEILTDTMCKENIELSRFKFAYLVGTFKATIEQFKAKTREVEELDRELKFYESSEIKKAIRDYRTGDTLVLNKVLNKENNIFKEALEEIINISSEKMIIKVAENALKGCP